jgi:adenine phosphoribosyltransferase
MDIKPYIWSVKDFPRPGVDFKDITPLLQEPAAFRWCTDRMVERFRASRVEKVAAFDARGWLFGTVVAYELGVPLAAIRKRGKLPRETIAERYEAEYGAETIEIHRDAVHAGERVLLIDDVIAFGACMRAGISMVERLGGVVVGCCALLEFAGMRPKERLHGYEVMTVVQY